MYYIPIVSGSARDHDGFSSLSQSDLTIGRLNIPGPYLLSVQKATLLDNATKNYLMLVFNSLCWYTLSMAACVPSKRSRYQVWFASEIVRSGMARHSIPTPVFLSSWSNLRYCRSTASPSFLLHPSDFQSSARLPCGFSTRALTYSASRGSFSAARRNSASESAVNRRWKASCRPSPPPL